MVDINLPGGGADTVEVNGDNATINGVPLGNNPVTDPVDSIRTRGGSDTILITNVV